MKLDEPNDEDINKRIAEFMGWKPWKENVNYLVDPNHDFYRSLSKNMPYCKSLDSLIPVIKKRSKEMWFKIEIEHQANGNVEACLYFSCDDIFKKAIDKKASSRALAKALFALLENKNEII